MKRPALNPQEEGIARQKLPWEYITFKYHFTIRDMKGCIRSECTPIVPLFQGGSSSKTLNPKR